MPTGNLPSEGKALFEKVYEQAKKGSCKGDEECAARTAWSAVKGAGWSKDKEGNWHKKAELSEFSLRITKASMDVDTGEMRWLAVASDTEPDLANDEMTAELFRDFVERIEKGDLAPEDYRSEFWAGGMPYLSVSHYPDLNGDGVPGKVESVFIDGDYLKARGTFSDTPIGRACFHSVRKDLLSEKSKNREDKVRISIAFLDWMHKHKSNDYEFERKSLGDICPECIMELIKGEFSGRKFYKGQLVHLAQTRVPMNQRTLMEVDKSMTTRKEDAASIIGDELADELDEKAKLIGKSEALVIKSDDEPITEQTPPVEEVPVLVEDANTKKEEKKDEEEDEEYKDKKKMKEEKKSDLEPVLSALGELKSLLTPKSEASHPLDDVIKKFKADYDAVLKMVDISPDEKLQLVQQSFAEIGNAVVDTVKKSQVEEHPVPSGNSDTAQIAEVLKGVLDRLDLLDAKISNPIPTKQDVTVQDRPMIRRSAQMPQRTGIEQKLSSVSEPKSETPTLRDILRRTV